MKRSLLILFALVQLSLTACISVQHQSPENIKAIEQFLPQASSGSVTALYQLGSAYSNSYAGMGIKANTDNAFRYLLMAAEQDDLDAQLALGRYYRDGGFASYPKNAALRDLPTAVYWFERAAQRQAKSAYYSLVNFNRDAATPYFTPIQNCQWMLLAKFKTNACTTLSSEELAVAQENARQWAQ